MNVVYDETGIMCMLETYMTPTSFTEDSVNLALYVFKITCKNWIVNSLVKAIKSINLAPTQRCVVFLSAWRYAGRWFQAYVVDVL